MCYSPYWHLQSDQLKKKPSMTSALPVIYAQAQLYHSTVSCLLSLWSPFLGLLRPCSSSDLALSILCALFFLALLYPGSCILSCRVRTSLSSSRSIYLSVKTTAQRTALFVNYKIEKGVVCILVFVQIGVTSYGGQVAIGHQFPYP